MSEEKTLRTEDLLKDMEELRERMPIDAFLRESKEFEDMMDQLDRAYDKREKVIDHILTDGNGLESRKALRMFPTALLEKWDEALKTSRPKPTR
jgi:hypothetical protein